MQKYAPIVLRLAMSFVFLYFAISQLYNPAQWVGFLPSWTSALPISQNMFVTLNGLFELVFGGLLLLGLYTRLSSLLLGLHLVGIAYTIGLLDALGVRDLGLALATISIFLNGADSFSLDNKI